ncbi:hypothetical protein OIU34_09820 [Pararhizobium sp. BT-229]|uniref:DUF6998 domain-containing protein n=1 Tax=Pararhizobium sp. BT-229 TaxID=2986923 RepID=UPI0021F6B76F|nr:hypothetical protein [Pararhizobium sp. BT-229]MCV9962195.1 hypothetical protein [Pararhizobium sp. BT-229]
MDSAEAITACLERARDVAVEYYRLTGKPLGITGEIGEYFAAKLLGLDLAVARTAGYDAVGADGRRVQIKSRALSSTGSHRVGGIKLTHDWHTVVLVIMSQDFVPLVIYEAERAAVEKAILAPGSKARNERGALAISKFKSIAQCVWSATD